MRKTRHSLRLCQTKCVRVCAIMARCCSPGISGWMVKGSGCRLVGAGKLNILYTEPAVVRNGYSSVSEGNSSWCLQLMLVRR
ncbi:hypothetical protein JOB18_023356 [Solea senegalensis]|uniref:Secreted protein n=1 Tax=Solea senegalensis TaxID=28829 RepID=A0AAV6RZ40_SOLSE|nr:hypothetical protein JOB18_023356 [Solea senegalensis]